MDDSQSQPPSVSYFNSVLVTMAAVFLFLWYTVQAFRYIVRLVLGALILNVVCLCLVPVFIFRPCDVRNFQIAGSIFTQLYYLVFRVDVDVQNIHHINDNNPAVIVCNHQASVDLIWVFKIWPKRCTALAKKQILYSGAVGVTAWLAGTFFIDRLNHDKAKKTMIKMAKFMHDQTTSVLIFPEGTRSGQSDLLPFKKGAFHLAVQAQVPIIPVAIGGYNKFYDPKKKMLEPGKMLVDCMEPIPTKGLTTEDVPELVERVRNSMQDAINKLNQSVS